MGMIFDTHSHYTDHAFDGDRAALLTALPEKNVALVMQACVDLQDAVSIQQLADQYDYLYGSVGIHPENLDGGVPEDAYDQLKVLAQHKKVRAIGEIGLDYHYDGYDRSAQIALFRMQLALAKELDLPVIVHARDAAADCLELLREYRPAGVMHCFSGSAETAREVLALGMYIGFTGVLTFQNAKKARRALAEVPPDKLVLETDCPYMAPVPYRGKRCDSSMIVHTADAAAQVMGLSGEQVLRLTLENGRRLYRI
ncbi:MAG: TatD family hydrolase [Ruminococcus sp.]